MFGKFIGRDGYYDYRWCFFSKKGKKVCIGEEDRNACEKIYLSQEVQPIFKALTLIKDNGGNKKSYIKQFKGYAFSLENKSPLLQKLEKDRKWSNYNQDYLDSSYWNKQRMVIRRKYKRCVFCNTKEKLCVHHRTYKHRGEKLKEREDLFLFCKECHETLHKTRPIGGKIRI